MTPEHTQQDEREDEHRYLCGCGDPACWCDDRDETNIHIGNTWYADACGRKHPVVIADLDQAYRRDVERDDFNERRR